MIRNYFKVAIRNLVRHPGYAAINIAGLAIGITCCTLIMLFVRSELSFDRFHTKSDRIYRAWLHEKYSPEQEYINTATPLPLGKALESNFPDVESTCRVFALSTLVKRDEASFNESIRMVDGSFFTIFDFPLLEGNPENPFPTPNSIIITQSTAKKYFGKESPMGKELMLQMGEEEVRFTVSGIAENAPEPSSIRFELLIPFSNEHYFFSESAMNGWQQVFVETYVLMRPHTSATALVDKFPSLIKQISGEDFKPGTYVVNLQPITSIHLDDSLPAGIEPISSAVYSYILSSIGFLILLIACINFITLSIGRSTSRSLEVGVRKVFGALRQQLVRQFWGEAILITLLAILISLAASLFLLRPFNQLIDRQLTFAFDPLFILFCLLMLFTIGLIAGMYPAFVLSGFSPIEALKGKVKAVGKIGLMRRALIVGQFTASIAMIICTLLAAQQLSYVKHKDLGYQKDHVVIVPANKDGQQGSQLARLYRDELRKDPDVKNAAISIFTLAEVPWAGIGYKDDNGQYRKFSLNQVNADFINTMGIQIVAGRNFSGEDEAEKKTGMIVNEALVKEYGWDNPIGKKLPGKFPTEVIGVMKDFNYESLHTPIEPLVVMMDINPILQAASDVNFSFSPQPRISVLLRPGNLENQIASLKKSWSSVAPGQDFEYHFLDEAVAAQYKQEQHTNAIIQIASILSILIACLGLFGLVTLVVTQRTREIGIRKVLGAGIRDIVTLISKDFAAMIIIASVLAAPMAWYGMNKWLQDFAYRITIEWYVFFIATIIALLIAMITISVQAMRAATANPIKSLRTE